MTLGCGKQTHYITRHGIAVFSKVITQSHPLLQFSHKINHFLLISNQFKHPPLSLKNQLVLTALLAAGAINLAQANILKFSPWNRLKNLKKHAD